MWTPEQSSEIQAIARSVVPGIKTTALPQGLQVERGPDAVVEYLFEKVPSLIDSLAEFKKAVTGFRQHLPDLNTPRFQISKEQSPYEYSEAFQKNHVPPWLYNLTETWKKLLEEPYKGVTADGESPKRKLSERHRLTGSKTGKIIPGLFQIQDEGVPIEKIVKAVNSVLTQLTTDQKRKVSYPLNAKEWRTWSNPEFLLPPVRSPPRRRIRAHLFLHPLHP